MKGTKCSTQGFTLLELLVVVLIIGILASIALPQYQMAVTKAKVASILPLMRRWKDAMYEYKLQHGSYVDENGDSPDGATLGVSWPSDWKRPNRNEPCGDSPVCGNDFWDRCYFAGARVLCAHEETFGIVMYSSDAENEFAGMTTCEPYDNNPWDDRKGEKVCKALGGKLLEDAEEIFLGGPVYKLN